MISGDLIRIKNMVDDCVRMARTIQRDAERLTPEERDSLKSHIAVDSKPMQFLMTLVKPTE
jgi:hypothetical protein